MSYIGKEFVLDSQENFEAFIDSLGGNLAEDIKKSILNFKSTSKLVKNGDKYTLISGNFNGTNEVTFTPGVQYDENPYGKPAKSVTTIDGDTFTTVQNFDNGAISYTREYSDDQLVVTIKSSLWDGVAKRIFKA